MSKQSDTNQALEIDKGYFPITSLHRDDIKKAYYGTDEYETMCKVADAMEDHEMEHLASKMADDYCEQLYWDSLRVLFELKFEYKIKEYQDQNPNPDKN